MDVFRFVENDSRLDSLSGFDLEIVANLLDEKLERMYLTIEKVELTRERVEAMRFREDINHESKPRRRAVKKAKQRCFKLRARRLSKLELRQEAEQRQKEMEKTDSGIEQYGGENYIYE